MGRTPATIRSTTRARELAKRRHSVDTAINQIVRAWPDLTETQRSRVSQLVRPTPDNDRGAAQQ